MWLDPNEAILSSFLPRKIQLELTRPKFGWPPLKGSSNHTLHSNGERDSNEGTAPDFVMA